MPPPGKRKKPSEKESWIVLDELFKNRTEVWYNLINCGKMYRANRIEFRWYLSWWRIHIISMPESVFKIAKIKSVYLKSNRPRFRELGLQVQQNYGIKSLQIFNYRVIDITNWNDNLRYISVRFSTPLYIPKDWSRQLYESVSQMFLAYQYNSHSAYVARST